MLVHTVLFWLREDLTEEEFKEFRRGLEPLRSIVYTKAAYVGTPARTEERPTIDNTYSVAITLIFENIADHDSYQIHPMHKAFLNRFKTYWTKVLIYDFD